MNLPILPVSDAVPALLDALQRGRSAVLVAPPGAGKTTLVPLFLRAADWVGDKKIIVLEPRRLAARAAARRMAELLGEEPGGIVGYSMRMESRVSARTRIQVVTEGLLTRMILDDPELPGIAAVIFDEFHERSLDGDFALALALDVQAALRPELRLLVMSATLDGARVARLLGQATPVIRSEGRSFPVAIRYAERLPGGAIEDAMASAIRTALAEEPGSVLAFLPGQREILRTAERLEGRLPANVSVAPLYGLLDARAQDAAIQPAAPGSRKVVLASAIAETSLTIEGIRVVIDSGLSRLPRYEPATGLTRLETVRASRASVEQRAGRAGRTAPGVAIRLWRAEQTAALPFFTPPEMLAADLSRLLLDCAAFGVSDPTDLAFLDPPPAPAVSEARALLTDLGALDADSRPTREGRAMRDLALPVRLAHMVVRAAEDGQARDAAELAVLLTERGLGGDAADLERRLDRFRSDNSPRAKAARQLAQRLANSAPAAAPGTGKPAAATGTLLLHAFPDRVAKARGERGRFVLASGGGARIDAADPLAGENFLVVADLQGTAQNARIASAAALGEAEIRATLAARIKTVVETAFDLPSRSVRARETVRLGHIVFSEHGLAAPRGAFADTAIIAALRRHGLGLLPWDKGASAWRDRLGWLFRALGSPWPDVSDAALIETLDDWLLPFLSGEPALDRIAPDTMSNALLSLVPHDIRRTMETLAPSHFEAPSGRRLPILYAGEWPVLAIRVQELFGLDRHPSIAGGAIPLTLELLSPAQRPIQTTRDLPVFWRGSWRDVRADLRGRYPRHPWPEDPLAAPATFRVKPRAK